MEKYLTYRDFENDSGVMPLLKSISLAVPVFWPLTLFFFWILGTGSSYFIILKTTGKKRFWHSLTAMSFSTFIFSLIIAAMNTATTTFLSGYWVGFYLLMTLVSYFALSQYK